MSLPPERRAQLRRRALARLAAQAPAHDPVDPQQLLHELQLQRIELELQNEDLQQARAGAEALSGRYAELYEQAPIGYLTLDAGGRIVQANPMAADLLGAPLERLVGGALAERIDRMDRPAFHAFMQRLDGSEGNLTCVLTLSRADHALRIVHVDARCSTDGRQRWLTLSDSTGEQLSSAALRRSETRLRLACQRLAAAQETERVRLTEQLHDRVGRNLTALGLMLTLLEEELAGAAAPLHERLADGRALLRDTVSEVRNLMSELYPPMLKDFGLYAALRWWCAETGKRSGIDVQLQDGEPGLRLPFEVESALFRIAQEALANAIRHGRPGRVVLALHCRDGRLQLEIVDDGCGFEVEPPTDDERGSWGLMLMRERALAIGATLQIESATGAGTRVRVETDRVDHERVGGGRNDRNRSDTEASR